eukprot:TRINITY_DN161_c0_g1_i1.p1 TRINITY_DN161_c0_g1~~TRINITY_DN161_c0_g1_i1.p1  ORF type:complete len:231 (+),score=22.22 TRINITY_DN161_c0_g1_i1:80-694(+)
MSSPVTSSAVIMAANIFYPLFVLSMVAGILSGASGASNCTAPGKNVTAEGFLMDNYCIKQGVLADNPRVISLQNPEVHTIECLVKLAACVESGYVILAKPNATGGNYTIMYDLGVEGSALAKVAAEEESKAGKMAGLQLKVTGINDGMDNKLHCVSVYKLAANTPTLASPSPKVAPSPAPSSASGTRTSLLSMILFSILAAMAA